MADETILVADQYALWHTPSRHHYGVDSRREARDWRLASNVLGPRPRHIALVAEDDSHGMTAYRDADYEILGMNGNREFELESFIGRMQEILQLTPPKHLILVTTDPAFVRLCRSAIAQPNVRLSVWGPADQTPPELALSAFNFRTLEELLPQSTTTAVDVRVDFENLYLGLLRLGWRRDIKALVQTVRDLAGEFGDVIRIVAYGDWDWLAERGEPGLQRELFLAGVETRYEVNIQGKNSSDMVIARDIQSMLERASTLDGVTEIVMLGTCDRDFRPTLQLAQACRKRVILLTLKHGLSELLRVVAGNEIRYLDERLGPAHRCQPSRTADETRDDLAAFVVQAEVWFRRQGQTWAGVGVLSDALGRSPAQSRWVEDAIETGVLDVRVRPADSGGDELREVQLAAGHPLMGAVRHLLDWAPQRIRNCLQTKGMPYVDTKYLFDGMRLDAACQQWGIGQTRRDAERWLDRLAGAGLIVKKVQPHPFTPTNLITTWALPDSRSYPQGLRPLQSAADGRRRIVLLR